MRRLGRNLKMTKNSATPRAKEVNSRLRRHSQSIAKLRLTLPALRASQVATSAPSTSSVPVQNTIARSSTLAIGHDRRSSVSNTSLRAARRPPNRRGENHRKNGRAPGGRRERRGATPARALPPLLEPPSGTPPAGGGAGPPHHALRPT